MPKPIALFPMVLLPLWAEPRFLPNEADHHPIVTTIKLLGMIATVVFVLVMTKKVIKRIQSDEDDSVHLPD